MNAVVHRVARTLEIASRVAEAPGRAKLWGGRGVNVNDKAPGCTATANTEASREDPQYDQAIPGRIPSGRRRGAYDLAGATVFPASSASEHVDGIVPPADGGRPGR